MAAERRGIKALELWCRRMTEGYPGVKIDNMTTSWRDGLAFCAMIHRFRPDLIEFDKLNRSDVYYNNELAFTTAEKYLGIPALLDADDMAAHEVPDRLSILTYLSQFYQAFGAQDSPNRLKRPSPAAEKSQMTKPPGPPSKMAHVVGVPRRDPCQKCQLPVFLAERLAVGKNVYHRTCLKCARCGAQLTPGSFYETEVDNEYCCETCPDEEIAEEVAISESVLRRASINAASAAAAVESDIAPSPSTKVVRGSIADRLAFFEHAKGSEMSDVAAARATTADSKLLQKSVSDEEKSKSLQRMEVKATPSPTAAKRYTTNAALSSFLGNAADGEEGGSELSSSAEDKTGTQMDTSDTDEVSADADDLSADLEPPALPTTPAPDVQMRRLETIETKKRFTATAELQLTPAKAVTAQLQMDATNGPAEGGDSSASSKQNLETISAPAEDVKDAEDNLPSLTAERKKTEMQLNLAANIESAHDSVNNNDQQQQRVLTSAESTDVEKERAEEELSHKLKQQSEEINLELSATIVNECITKEKIADSNNLDLKGAEAPLAPTPSADSTENTEQPAAAISKETTAAVDADTVAIRTKSKLSPAAVVEDAETTERLSVVRARLQQFEVIANNKQNIDNDNHNANTMNPAEISLSASVKDASSHKSQENSTSHANSNSTETIEIEPKSMPQTNVEDEVKLHAIEASRTHNEPMETSIEPKPRTATQIEFKAENANEVPLDMETKDKESISGTAKSEQSAMEIDIGKPNEVELSKPKEVPIAAVVVAEENLRNKVVETYTTKNLSREKIDEYPEDLNPFKSDEEEGAEEAASNASNSIMRNKENVTPRPRTLNTTASKSADKHNSSNPFDSSDDEIELEKSQHSSAATTPSGRVKPPRPPPPRISRNPFGEDTDEDSSANLSRRSSLTSSLTRKTPVPTPRTNLSQSRNPTPEPTPRLSTKTLQGVLQDSSDYYGSANSLSATPAGLQRDADTRGSNNSLTSSAGGTIRSRKHRKAPAPPPPPTVKELFPSTETVSGSSKTSTPTSSTRGTPKMSRKKRLAPAPPKPARLDSNLVAPITLEHENSAAVSKNSLSYPLQSELDSKLSDEEKALLEGKVYEAATATGCVSQRSSRRLIPLDASLLEDRDADADPGGDGVGESDDAKRQQQRQQYGQGVEEEHNVVYRRVLMPPMLDTPTHDSNSLLGEFNEETHDRQLEKLKDNKEAQNRNRQSQLSSTSSGAEDGEFSALYNKSVHGKWKRRKGPAPALPIPPRKVLQMLPLQEIRHELEIIEVQQQGLEKQGVILEKMIRDRCEGDGAVAALGNLSAGAEDVGDGEEKTRNIVAAEQVQNSKEVEDLILQLFELVNEKNELFRRQAELMYLRRQHRLEQEQADLEYEIRVLMAQPERNKTDSDKAREEALIARMVEVVQRRNEVIECLEMDRLREAEEDLSIKQRLELHTARREGEKDDKKALSKLSKKEKKKQKEAKKLSKSKKLDADKDADESELSLDKQKAKKKKKKFLF